MDKFDKYWSGKSPEENSKKFDHFWSFLPKDINSIIDIGGGVGSLYYSMKRNNINCEYTLVENSNSAISIAKGNNINVYKHNIDEKLLPFKDKSFDIVIACDVLEHLRNPWAVLAEMSRITNKYIFIYGPNFASLKCRLDLLLGYPIRQMSINKYGAVVNVNGEHIDHIYFITYKNIIYWAKKLGLCLHKSRCFWYKRHAPFRWLLEPFFKNFGNNYEIILYKNNRIEKKNNLNFRF